MRDPALEAYVIGIERHLSRCRGREHVLSPPEFELARQWFGAGVAIGTVLTGIDEACTATQGSPAALTSCRRFVEALTKPARKD